MQRLFRTASSVIVSDITLGTLGLDSLELFPSYIPDLSLESQLMISGTCKGTFPESVKVTGILADMTKFEVDLPVQREKDIQLTNVLAKRHMDLITSQAWLSESTELEEMVSKMSIQLKIPSEYTCMVLVENGDGKKPPEPVLIKGSYSKLTKQRWERNTQKLFLGGISLGFGNSKATADNVPQEAKPSEGLLKKATSTCCGLLADNYCGMCLLQTCRFFCKRPMRPCVLPAMRSHG
ncbi:hypothetical protein PIB30_011061 [Stylosanthes scabra]|uniref:Uncharacterized protein n=1 Tax=Stylosanthes scabra TaxID=79078 RepID=A0ABU6X405_9FABA|nr:hypothetical protein [Stylosanthes scabra]